jgi:hypothetical protein
MDTFLISKGEVMKCLCDEKTKKNHSRMAWSQEKNDDSQQSETTTLLI